MKIPVNYDFTDARINLLFYLSSDLKIMSETILGRRGVETYFRTYFVRYATT